MEELIQKFLDRETETYNYHRSEFHEYDNHEDMELMDKARYAIRVLKEIQKELEQ